MSRKPNNLINNRYGKLLVVEITDQRVSGGVVFKCICDCGNQKLISGYHLTSGNTKSCGCAQYDTQFKHGLRYTLEYGIWSSMLGRCTNLNDPSYHLYGGRGITVCERWKTFENFYNDIGNSRPSEKHSLERENTNGNYEPSNVSWATCIDQANNRRNNVHVEYCGEDFTIAELARKHEIPYKRLYKRLDRGWSVEKAIAK